MKKIGLISDTHGIIAPQIYDFLSDCDEIWHAGDIGSQKVAQELKRFKNFKAVYGNIDDLFIRNMFPEVKIFQVELLKVVLIHIGGYPGKYTSKAKELIANEKPDIFVSGHSHILKIMFDKKHNLMYMNPGAAGRQGLHQKITLVKFKINGKEISDLEIMEKEKS